ncbi:3-isopropylmalate dehydratase small subunit [Sphingomonas sp. HMWF008]|nr:3-isopropylmalate dehydratase small subunit [Sphingomonas sp. HMWF008]
MTPFDTLTGIAAPLLQDDIDTDLIIPGRFLKTVTRTGLGDGLFDSLRRDEGGAERPDFVLNQPAFHGAAILIAGDNFGCGSSREHAPWALLDYGIRCVIAPGFGDIFFSNSVNCGLLPARMARAEVAALAEIVAAGGVRLTIDLIAQQVSGAGEWSFDIPPAARARLLQGLDPIGETLQQLAAIEAYEARR